MVHEVRARIEKLPCCCLAALLDFVPTKTRIPGKVGANARQLPLMATYPDL
jgi:hypothetical protein